MDFRPDFDRSVEVRFKAHEAVRCAPARTFCVGGPRNTPHILLQQRLAPGASRTLALDLPRGSFHLRVVRRADAHLVAGGGAPGPITFTCAARTVAPHAAECGAGRVELTLVNDAPDEALVRLEREDWSENGVSAAFVSTLPEFRDLFSSEALAPGMDMAIRSLSFCFTDLKGSTALYEEVGDAPAYALVREHFKFMQQHIERNRGAVVKTMGDAVMAVFHSPADAVRTVCEIQADVARQRVAGTGAARFVIKIGGNLGPCIAVSTAGVLDYFGTTVNVAARAQGLSDGDDVVLTAALADRRDVAPVLAGFAPQLERFSSRLKGISGTVELVRIRLAAGAAPAPAPATPDAPLRRENHAPNPAA